MASSKICKHLQALGIMIAVIGAIGFLVATYDVQSAVADESDPASSAVEIEPVDPGVVSPAPPRLTSGETDLEEEPQVEVAPSLVYATHIQGKAWGKRTKAPKSSGARQGASTVDAFTMTLDPGTYNGGIAYRSHLASSGWQAWKRNGDASGTISKKARLDAVAIKLTGKLAKTYDIVYRVRVEKLGWLPWVSGATRAGKADGARIQAIQARLIERPELPRAKRTISNGLYTLSPAAASSLQAAVKSNSTKPGARVQLASTVKRELAQAWRITWKGNGYELMNVNSGCVLDAPKALKNSLSNVKQAKPTKSVTQRWAIEKVKGGYHLVAMRAGTHLAVTKRTPKAGNDLTLSLPDSSLPSAFKIKRASVLPTGTVRLFSKLGRTRLCAAMPERSLSNGNRPRLTKAADKIGERFVIAKSGNAFTIQAPESGKYLTAKGGAVVQQSRRKSRAQRWNVAASSAGGLQLVNVATGKALTVRGGSKKVGAKLALTAPSKASAQSWFPQKSALLPAGLFEFQARNATQLRLDVSGGSLSSGANATLYSRNGTNAQKFIVMPLRGGYYRINMALGGTALTVADSSQKAGANVRMETWQGKAAQFWKPVATDSGIAFVNKASGKRLAFAAARSKANVRQSSDKTPLRLTAWTLVETALNSCDEASYRNAINTAPGGGLKLGNASRYRVSKARWDQLVSAVNGCRSRGADLGFIMVDLDTGMTVSLNPDRIRFGASTIKGLYVTYLFEEYLEKGRLSWNDIGPLAWPTIVYSNNACYQALRSRFGNEAGFRSWLASAGVGYIGTWGSYSARTLASAWTHMAGYAASNGRYVGTWKGLFCRSDHSFIREALGGSNATYSKPGWMEAGAWCGTIMNDAGIVVDRQGGRYLLAFTSSINPSAHRWAIGRVAAALDAIHQEMASSSAR